MGLSRKKRNIVTSRLKAFYAFTETFQSALRSGWKVIRSGWTAGSGEASISDPTTYPLLSTTMASSNVTIDIKNPGIGTGAALWVTDSGEWYGLVTQQGISVGAGTCQTYNAYNSCGYTNPVNPCGARNTPYQQYDPPQAGYPNPYYPGNSPVCCNAGTPANSPTCCNPTIPGNYDYCAYTNPTYYICYGYAPYNGYLCGAFGTQCGQCTTEYGPYGGYCVRVYIPAVPGTPIPGNPAVPGNPIPGNSPIPSYTNPSYAGGWYWVYSDYCIATGGSCVATGGTCNTYNNLYPRYLKLIKYASNAVTELYSFTLDSVTAYVQAKGLKTIISNSSKGGTTATITAKVYSDEAMLTQIGSDMVYNATGVKINANYGIIASPSSYNQGNAVKSVSIS